MDLQGALPGFAPDGLASPYVQAVPALVCAPPVLDPVGESSSSASSNTAPQLRPATPRDPDGPPQAKRLAVPATPSPLAAAVTDPYDVPLVELPPAVAAAPSASDSQSDTASEVVNAHWADIVDDDDTELAQRMEANALLSESLAYLGSPAASASSPPWTSVALLPEPCLL